jgi:hypothetical protein
MESEAFGPWREPAQAHQREASASDRWVLPLALRSRRQARPTTSTRQMAGGARQGALAAVTSRADSRPFRIWAQSGQLAI